MTAELAANLSRVGNRQFVMIAMMLPAPLTTKDRDLRLTKGEILTRFGSNDHVDAAAVFLSYTAT
jgi:hypothetical protein